MRIESLTATPVRLPLAKSLKLLGGSTPEFTNVIVTICSTDGAVGYGEATPRPKLNGESVASVLDIVENALAPQLIGRDIHGLNAIAVALHGVQGNASAKAAVEAAALDALAKTLDVACHVLLGGFTDRIPCAGLLPLGPPSEVVEGAQEMHAKYGISNFKIKVGADLQRDISAAELLRAQYPDAVLYADANAGYDPVRAAAFLRAAEELHFTMVEEPTAHPGSAVRRRLTESTFVSVVGDESCTTTAQAIGALSAGCCSGVSIKAARTGLTGSAAVRQHATELGANVHIGYELVSALGAATSLAFACSSRATSAYPTESVAYLQLAEDIVADPVPVVAGHVQVPHGSGFGVEVDQQAVKALAIG